MTAMLAPEILRSSSLFSIGNLGSEVKPKITWAKKTNDDGSEGKVLRITDQPVFRSGTFRDSWGIQTTWEYMHIDQMILNYEHLFGTGIFEHIPVRKGHGALFDDPMNTLVGWHTGLSAEKRESKIDGKEYNYLLASYDLFDEEAAKHVAAGDWPNRSSEVGYFLTNAEAEHWPVYQGFAFVDIPAVEGLNFSKANPPSKHAIFMEREVVVGTTPTPPVTPPVKTTTNHTAPTDSGSTPAPEETPVETPAPQATPAATPAPEAEPPAETQPEPSPDGSGEHGKGGEQWVFTIGGKQVRDFAAVQTAINNYETVQHETLVGNRNDFVNGLATDKKILASQIKELSEFAQSLSPEQYAKWSATYESAPASELFGQHGADQGDNNGQPQSQATAAEGEKSSLVGIVSMHRANGMKEDKVKATATYQRLSQIAPDEYPI